MRNDDLNSEKARDLGELLRKVQEGQQALTDAYFARIEQLIRSFVSPSNEPPAVRAVGNVAGQANGGLVDRKQLAALLGISERTVSDLQNEGMPFHRFGRSVRFGFDEVIEWSKGRRIRRRNSKARVVA